MEMSTIDSKTERIIWVDSAKGLAIYLVMVGHLLNASSLTEANKIIYSFHTPLFFILSGLTYHHKGLRTQLIVAKARKLLYPYIAYMFLSLLFCCFYGQYELSIENVFYYNAVLYFDEPLWFLLVMFGVICIENITNASTWKNGHQIILMCLFFFFGFVCYEYRDDFAKVLNHFGINRIVISSGFFTMGNCLAKMIYGWKESTILRKRTVSVALLIICGLLWIGTALVNDRCSMYALLFGDYFLFLLGSLAGSICIMLLCYRFLHMKTLLALSKYGILLLGSQYFWLIPLRDFFVEKGINNLFVYNLICFILPSFGAIASITLYKLLSSRFQILKVLNGELR